MNAFRSTDLSPRLPSRVPVGQPETAGGSQTHTQREVKTGFWAYANVTKNTPLHTYL